MSVATIDLILTPDRVRTSLKGRETTEPGVLLKSQIRVHPGTRWSFAALEDIVAHLPFPPANA